MSPNVPIPPGLLAHEWLEPTGGSENVFEDLHEILQPIEAWCLWNDAPNRFRNVRETWIAKTPLRHSKVLALLPMLLAWRHRRRTTASWVLTSSHLFAHHARFVRCDGGPLRKIVYAHTPARYIWVPWLDPRGSSVLVRLIAPALKRLDRRRAQEAVAIAANSNFVAERISATWAREAEVIYPPVDVSRFTTMPVLTDFEATVLQQLPADFLLGVSRFVPYKRLDLVLAAGVASGMPVVIAGAGGPDEDRLRRLAKESGHDVHFVVAPSQGLLQALLAGATAVVFPPVEDFGIVPVESMAAGTPVLVNEIGGAAESVIDGVTGVVVRDWTDANSLRSAVAAARTCKPEDCKQRAAHFSRERFAVEIREFVARHNSGLAHE